MRLVGITLFSVALLIAGCSVKQETAESGQGLTYLPTPADSLSSGPFLFTDNKGVVHLSWVEKSGEMHALKVSTLENDKWTSPSMVAEDSTWFVNWADYSTLATDGQNFVSHVQDKSGKGTFEYDVKLFFKKSGSESWSSEVMLNTDSVLAEHGFVSMMPYEDKILVAWLDGRNAASAATDHEGHDGMHQGEMSLRAAILDYDGNRFREWELDKRTCDCCQTAMAMTENGPVVIYRDRSEDEIRDISIVRLIDGEWTSPTPIHIDNWKIAGCPVNGPRLSTIGNSMVAAWYTVVDNSPMVNVSFSADGGASFGDAMRLTEVPTNGRVDVVMIDETTAVVSWLQSGTIVARTVNKTGEKGEIFEVAATTDSRSSGFPQMTLQGSDLIFAWTDATEKQVKVAKVNVSAL